MSLDEIEAVLSDFCKSAGRSITKTDFATLPVPSYNTCIRRGISLIDINRKFSESQYKAFPKTCKSCDKEISFERRVNTFCSQSCAARYNNPLKPKKADLQEDGSFCRPPVQPICDSCLGPVTSGRKYCCQQCSADKRYYDGLFQWLFIKGSQANNRVLRKYLCELSGYSCAECGISDWNGKKLVLEVEHIDGNSENNSPSNVCLICPNCHSQTSTYKGKNKGNGRHARRERYKEGKSY